MKTASRSLREDAAKTMVHAFVTSRVDYCNSILHHVSAVHAQPLQNVLNTAAWIILSKRKFDCTAADLPDQQHWLLVQQHIEYKLCVLVYKCLHEAALTNLSEMVTLESASVSWRHLDSATHDNLAILCSRTTTYGQRSLAVSDLTLWNTLPCTNHT